jgi:outer membrane protein assembly factor BamB
MGLLIKKILPVLILLIFSGCAVTKIKLSVKADNNAYTSFGNDPGRNFYSAVQISDSVRLLWSESVNGNFSHSSAAVYDEYLFVSDLSGRVYAFNALTGKKAGMLKSSGAVYTTPILGRFTVCFTTALINDNKSVLTIYDFDAGQVKSEKTFEGKSITNLVFDDQKIFIVTENGIAYCFDLNGSLLWERSTGINTHSTPAIIGNKICFGNDKGEIILLDKNSGAQLYSKKYGSVFWSGITVKDNFIFTADETGKLFMIDSQDGSVKWIYKTNSRVNMNPVCDNENVYVGNLKGDFYSIRIFDGTLNWKTETRGSLSATPLVTDNIIIQPDLNKKILFIDRNNGIIRKELFLEGRAKLSPIIFDDKLFIGYDNGVLEAYEFIY